MILAKEINGAIFLCGIRSMITLRFQENSTRSFERVNRPGFRATWRQGSLSPMTRSIKSQWAMWRTWASSGVSDRLSAFAACAIVHSSRINELHGRFAVSGLHAIQS